jgi:hypothetical protein
MFKLALTYYGPAQGGNVQRGFPAPGAFAQTTGGPSQPTRNEQVRETPVRPSKGIRSFFDSFLGGNAQRGMPEPQNTAQHRPAGSMPNHPIVQALPWTTTTPYYDRGAAAVVQNFGKVLTNPIGAGIVALNRPQASYGRASEYHYGSLWWTSQNIPTSVDLTSLVSADDLSAALGPLNVQAAVRTTGG